MSDDGADGGFGRDIAAFVSERLPGGMSGGERKLALVLSEYDHAHCPSNWERWGQEYPGDNVAEHVEFIAGWAKDLFDREPGLVSRVFAVWDALSPAEREASCGQWGEISEMLYDEMMDYTT